MNGGKEKSIDDYICIEIWYRLFGWIVYFIIFLVVLYGAFQLDIQLWVFAIFMMVLIMLLVFRDMKIIYHKKKIKDYVVEQGLIGKIGKILYWYCHENCSSYHHDFVLTDYYIIVLYKKEIVSFRYEDIVSILAEIRKLEEQKSQSMKNMKEAKEKYEESVENLHRSEKEVADAQKSRADALARVEEIRTTLKAGIEEDNKSVLDFKQRTENNYKEIDKNTEKVEKTNAGTQELLTGMPVVA